jgi:hypothetical protein
MHIKRWNMLNRERLCHEGAKFAVVLVSACSAMMRFYLDCNSSTSFRSESFNCWDRVWRLGLSPPRNRQCRSTPMCSLLIVSIHLRLLAAGVLPHLCSDEVMPIAVSIT